MRFEPENPDDVIRLYKSGVSIKRLAEECGVATRTMERFLQSMGVRLRRHIADEARGRKNYSHRPPQITGEAFSDDWWDSNNQAFCDAMVREYPTLRYRDRGT